MVGRLGALFAVVALVSALGGSVLGSAAGRAGPAAVACDARSYRPGQVAGLLPVGHWPRSVTLQVFAIGAPPTRANLAAGYDQRIGAKAVSAPRQLSPRPGQPIWVPIGDWPSGLYVARLVATAFVRYAPFIVRATAWGTSPVLVVEPTNTWQAYNKYQGDSWYHDPSVHLIRLDRPYQGLGLPPHFIAYDLGFSRWYAHSGFGADFVADDDLNRLLSTAQLRHLYRLVVFPGHEEYVTRHVYDLIQGFRDRGGSLAFLSANSFYFQVTVSGSLMHGRTRWRDLGRPEASLVGAQYVGWEQNKYPNRPYTLTGLGFAPWLFTDTNLGDGDRFGWFGIEVDSPTPASPKNTHASSPGSRASSAPASPPP